MPTHCERRDGAWRLVEPDGTIATTDNGRPRDGGGHSSRAKCERQRAAVDSNGSKAADDEVDLTPNNEMAANARRALRWKGEGKPGGTSVGMARARQLVRRQRLSAETVRRMRGFFARHRGDRDTTGFRQGEPGFPTPGRVAWDLWGGDAGDRWSRQKVDQLDRAEKHNGDEPMAEYRTLPFDMKAAGEGDDQSGRVSGWGNLYNVVDLGGDIVAPGAFRESLEQSKGEGILPAMLWQHNPADPIGVWDDLQDQEKGLWVEGRLDTSDARYRKVRMGAATGLSIGFIPKERSYDEDTGVRTITRATLMEVSLVTFPMNWNSRVEAIKTAIQDLRGSYEGPRLAERALREAGFTRDEAKAIVAGGFKAIAREADDPQDKGLEELAASLRGITNSFQR